MRTPLTLILLPAALLAALAPSVASATAIFPDAVKTDLSLTYTPPCTICHQTDSGGTGTATRAFGVAMKQNGLASGDTTSLQAALTALESAGTDSDGDCTPDIQQLKDGRDPNTGVFIDGSGKPAPVVDGGCGTGGGGNGAEIPAYGCGAQLSAAPLPDSSLPIAATLATVAGLALSRRRRRA